MMDTNKELTTEESDFASNHRGLVRRGDTWYRLHGWGTADDWASTPLVRVPDDHAALILGVEQPKPSDPSAYARSLRLGPDALGGRV